MASEEREERQKGTDAEWKSQAELQAEILPATNTRPRVEGDGTEEVPKDFVE